MSNEERKAIAIANSGRGMSRVQIAQRAVDKAQEHLDACKARLQSAIVEQGRMEEKHARKAEAEKGRLARMLEADAELQAQARRILAQLDKDAKKTK